MSVAKLAQSAGILYRGNRAALVTRRGMDLRCTQCGSTYLKKVSLAYQQGLFHVRTRGRLLGLVFGNDGPSFVTGATASKGTHQTHLSSLLTPPERCSYLRLLLRFGVAAFLGFVACVIFVIVSTPPVSSVPIKLMVFVAPIAFCVCGLLAWRHNNLVYPVQFARWNHSFLCEKCGAVRQYEVPQIPSH